MEMKEKIKYALLGFILIFTLGTLTVFLVLLLGIGILEGKWLMASFMALLLAGILYLDVSLLRRCLRR